MAHGIDRAVQPQRKSDRHNTSQHPPVHPVRQIRKAELRILFTDVDDAEQPGAVHGYGSRQRRTGHIHAHTCHKQEIQNNVHNTGYNQKQQRRVAVSHSPQDSRIHIVSHIPQSSEKNDADISIGQFPRIIRHLHEPQNRRTGELPDDRQRYGTQK